MQGKRRPNATRSTPQVRHAATASHQDLRTLGHDMTANFMVLESSFGQLKAALKRPPHAAHDELVAHVEACLSELKQFVEDVRQLAGTGSVTMEPSHVDLEAVIDEVLFEQRDVLSRRGIAVEVRRPLPGVWCHRHRLKQVITNLVRNAALHGCDPREPKLTLSADSQAGGHEASPAMVSIRVHDNGPGIDPALAEEVFLPGRRLPGLSGEGSGMGLAIVRRTVEHYGGSVRIDAQCASGTAVEAILPAARAGHAPARPHWELVSGPNEPGTVPFFVREKGDCPPRASHDVPHGPIPPPVRRAKRPRLRGGL